MIKLITEDDMHWVVTKLQEVMDRTKRQTKQIMELQKQLKEIKEFTQEGSKANDGD